MDQQFDTINRRFAQLEQANVSGSEVNTNLSNTAQKEGAQHTPIRNQGAIRNANMGSNEDMIEGNYPPTPTLNRLIIEASSTPQAVGSKLKPDPSSTK